MRGLETTLAAGAILGGQARKGIVFRIVESKKDPLALLANRGVDSSIWRRAPQAGSPVSVP